MRKGNARAYMQFLQDSKIPFELECSNYTIAISASDELQQKFVANMQSNRTFAAFAKIKSNVKDKPVPLINKDDIVYFIHDFKQSSFISKVINIDLKSCYATVLFNDGMITEDTFKYLSRLNKQERLASVGMLASRKKKFSFSSNSDIYDFSEKVSPTSAFFFYAVKRTYEIMTDLRNIIGNSYLFTWVDGIYFSDETKVAECREYLAQINFKYTIDELKDFDLRVLDKKILLLFKKWDNKKGDYGIKTFNLPSPTTEFQNLTLKAIQSLNNKSKKHETGKSKISRKAVG